MKRRDVLVEVDCEEIKTPAARPNPGFIVPQSLVEVMGGSGSNGADLFITSGISRDEQDRNTFELRRCVNADLTCKR
jgi:hypothetical protein